MDISNLNRSLKAAILIHTLGPQASQGIMAGLEPGQRETVKQHLNEMGNISPDIVEKVAEEFLNDLRSKSGFQQKQLSAPTVNQKKHEKKDEKKQTKKLSSLESLEPEQIVDLIKDEHPQTIAAIALHLESHIASEVLSAFPDELIIDVSLRIANLNRILSGMIEEIDEIFKEILSNKNTSTVQKTSGIDQLAEILNLSDQIIAEQILEDIEQNNPELAEEIKQKMFVFEDLVLIDDKGMQKILRKVETGELALALKGASDEAKQKIFKNMSKRAAEMLSEEIEALGAVRMKDVESAQAVINKIIQDMVASNEIIITGRGGEQFIA